LKKLNFLYLFFEVPCMYRGLAIIFTFLFIGEGVERLFNLPIPGNVIGLILLTFALLLGIVRLEDVEKEAELFVKNMSIMFIPPGVGIILYWELIKDQAIPIFGALLFSFLFTLLLTAKLVEFLGRRENE